MRVSDNEVGGILSYFTRHATLANLLLLIMIVLGLYSASQIRAQFFPDVVVDGVTIRVYWEGAGPEDLDLAVVEALEPALQAVEGVIESTARSVEGRATMRLEFEPDWEMARAAEDVTTAVDRVTTLPDGIEDPVVTRDAWRDRVTDVILHGPVSREQLGQYADEFVQRLFRQGVTRATARGVVSPDIDVTVRQATLVRHDIGLADIARVIGESVESDPAGETRSGDARIRSGVAKRTVESIGDLVVRAQPDGDNLLLRDVAEVAFVRGENGRQYYVGDNPAISVRVDRADQGDAIDMQAIVEDEAEAYQVLLPEGVRVELIRTRAEAISQRLGLLIDNGLLGLALVVGLLFLFLSARTAFWVAAGIPVAMMAAIAMMHFAGITLNMVSLFGLIICLGIVVDDAIVVGEHADFRARQLGEGPTLAAVNAARRMSAPVVSATITTVIAFFGLISIGGRFGSLIVDIPFTVIVVLLASLAECFLILPNHMRHALTAIDRDAWYDAPSRAVNRAFNTFRLQVFKPLMGVLLRARYPLVAACFALLALSIGLLLRGDVPWRFFNAPERASVSANLAMLPGAKREDTLAMVREAQRAVEAVGKRLEEKHGTNPVMFVLAEVGGTTGRGLANQENKLPEQLGSVAIELIDPDDRPYSSAVFISAVEEEVGSHPLLETLAFRRFRSGPGGDSLDVDLVGADSRTLKQAAETLKSAVAEFPIVSAIEDNLSWDKVELVLELTARGEALGFSTDSVGRELFQRLNGVVAAEYPVGPRTGEIRVQLVDDDAGGDVIDTTLLRSPGGDYIALSDIVRVRSQFGFATVLRENGERVLTVTGDVSEDDPEAATQFDTQLRETILPAIESEFGVRWRLSGLAEQERNFLNDARTGFMLCLLGIYLTLSWIFASWTRPIVVMSVIPFGLTGALYGHWQWDVPLSMFSVIGLIGMTGIIINDSIILVSTIDDYLRDRDWRSAIIDAVVDRLRPVLLTTLTTVLGLTPLLFESSQQAQFLKPTVISLCYGLGFGMVLVLCLVPALVWIQHDFRVFGRSRRRAFTGNRVPAGVKALVGITALASLLVIAVTAGLYAVTGQTDTWPLALFAGWLPEASAWRVVIASMVSGLLGVVLVSVVVAFFGRFKPRRTELVRP
ncbi:MAG: efflux RND transporter permease subunit [Pseudomonadota bacterium]